MANQVDPTITWLKATYNGLVGKTFRGNYNGELPMPQTGNVRDIIIVKDSLDTTLAGISRDVLQKYGSEVWKGITGPKDSFRYTEYWLWVEPAFSSDLSKGNNYNFKIEHCLPFQCGGGTFSYGVSIKVSLP